MDTHSPSFFMSDETYIATSEIRSVFQNKHDRIVMDDNAKIVVSHFGSFSQDLVSSIAERTEEMLKTRGLGRLVVKRIFSILIEGMQNIRNHGKKDEIDNQVGFVILSEKKDCINITFANVITFEDFERVEKYIKEINSYSEETLKSTYLKVLNNSFLSDKNGAGLGLLTMRMKSDNPLEYGFYALKSGKLLFTFKTKVKK